MTDLTPEQHGAGTASTGNVGADGNPPASDAPVFAQQVRQITTELADMLIAKNKSYGNSALDPVRVFSQSDTAEQIRVRIDDKLSRLQRGNAHNEDTILDLMGYLVLLRIAEAAKEAKP